MSGYPLGAENDSNAPYNKESCPDCEGTGIDEQSDLCSNCGGVGEFDEQREQDAYESFLEDTADE